MWKENGNTTTLVFSLKGLEDLHQGGSAHVKKHSGRALQQHPYLQVQGHAIKERTYQIIIYCKSHHFYICISDKLSIIEMLISIITIKYSLCM